MRNETRVLWDAYAANIATLNGATSATVKFNVAPTVQQTLITRQQESSDFLSRINMITVTEQMGEKLGLGVTGTIASRTNTAIGHRRQPIDPTGLQSRGYVCAQTNFDTALRYAKLDAWAKFDDFEERVRNAIIRTQALDIMRVGFNGVQIAAETDRVAHPDLSDVNIGWLEKARREAAPQVMSGATYGSTVAADFKSLDALVYAATQDMLPTWARNDTELVAIVSSDLLNDKYFPLMNSDQDPQNQLARDIIMSSKRLGNLPAVQVPFFPNGTVMVTRWDNLSVYSQENGRRRLLRDEPEYDRIANYESDNMAYVIEDTDYLVLVEGIAEAA